jgi:hypothetical protein
MNELTLSHDEKKLHISRRRIVYLQNKCNELNKKIKNINKLVHDIEKDIKLGDSGYYTNETILYKLQSILNK